MLGTDKAYQSYYKNNPDVIHALHRNSSTNSITLFVEPKHSYQPHRYSIPIKSQQPINRASIKYSTYPAVFQNKATNIRKILKNKEGNDHLQRVGKYQKQNKFNLLTADEYKNVEYYNFQYLFRTINLVPNLQRKSLQGKVTCRASHISSEPIEEEMPSQKMLREKRREEKRLTTEPIDKEKKNRKIKIKMATASELKKQLEINLSPWGFSPAIVDHLQN